MESSGVATPVQRNWSLGERSELETSLYLPNTLKLQRSSQRPKGGDCLAWSLLSRGCDRRQSPELSSGPKDCSRTGSALGWLWCSAIWVVSSLTLCHWLGPNHSWVCFPGRDAHPHSKRHPRPSTNACALCFLSLLSGLLSTLCHAPASQRELLGVTWKHEVLVLAQAAVTQYPSPGGGGNYLLVLPNGPSLGVDDTAFFSGSSIEDDMFLIARGF